MNIKTQILLTNAIDSATIIASGLIAKYAIAEMPNQRVGICLLCLWVAISALQRLSSPPKLEDL